MSKFLKVIIVLAALSLAVSLSALVVLSQCPDTPDPLAPDAEIRDIGLSIPAFSLTAHDGAAVTRDVFLGRVTIVSFIFTNCPNPCPMMTGTMADLHDALAADGAADVHFLSISVDPDHDTPAALADYAARYNADLSRWTFATAHGMPEAHDAIRRIVGDGLKFAIEKDPGLVLSLPGGLSMNQIVHPSWFVLVGPQADVLGLYRFDEADAMRQLHIRAKAIARKLRSEQ